MIAKLAKKYFEKTIKYQKYKIKIKRRKYFLIFSRGFRSIVGLKLYFSFSFHSFTPCYVDTYNWNSKAVKMYINKLYKHVRGTCNICTIYWKIETRKTAMFENRFGANSIYSIKICFQITKVCLWILQQNERPLKVQESINKIKCTI